jgi:hypothetical protein
VTGDRFVVAIEPDGNDLLRDILVPIEMNDHAAVVGLTVFDAPMW